MDLTVCAFMMLFVVVTVALGVLSFTLIARQKVVGALVATAVWDVALGLWILFAWYGYVSEFFVCAQQLNLPKSFSRDMTMTFSDFQDAMRPGLINLYLMCNSLHRMAYDSFSHWMTWLSILVVWSLASIWLAWRYGVAGVLSSISAVVIVMYILVIGSLHGPSSGLLIVLGVITILLSCLLAAMAGVRFSGEVGAFVGVAIAFIASFAAFGLTDAYLVSWVIVSPLSIDLIFFITVLLAPAVLTIALSTKRGLLGIEGVLVWLFVVLTWLAFAPGGIIAPMVV